MPGNTDLRYHISRLNKIPQHISCRVYVMMNKNNIIRAKSHTDNKQFGHELPTRRLYNFFMLNSTELSMNFFLLIDIKMQLRILLFFICRLVIVLGVKYTNFTCLFGKKSLLLKSLNIIYLLSITQKAQRTYRRVLEGADVGVLCSYVVEETGEPGGKPQTLDGRLLPCHMPTPGFDPGSQRWQASALTTALSRPLYLIDLSLFIMEISPFENDPLKPVLI